MADRTDAATLDAIHHRSNELRRLVKSLGLEGDAERIFAEATETILELYLAWKLDDQIDGSRATIRAHLKRLAADAKSLRERIELLSRFTRNELTYRRRDATDVRNASLVSPEALETELHDFEKCTRSLLHDLRPARSGTPGKANFLLRLKRIVEMTEIYTREEVTYQRTKRSVSEPHMTGRGGHFVRDAFMLFDPSLTDADIANGLRNLRDRERISNQPRIAPPEDNSRS